MRNFIEIMESEGMTVKGKLFTVIAPKNKIAGFILRYRWLTKLLWHIGLKQNCNVYDNMKISPQMPKEIKPPYEKVEMVNAETIDCESLEDALSVTIHPTGLK